MGMTSTAFRLDAPVIIVGGGPVGLSLALGLARYDVRSIILEPRSQPVEESRALVVWPRTLEIMRDWNAYEDLCEAGDFITTFRACNARTGTTIVDVDFSNLQNVLEDPGVLIIPQYRTERVLRTLVEAHSACDLRVGVAATAVVQSGEYVDVATNSNGAPGTLRGRYVVGCDGAHGITRHALGLSLEGITYDSRVVLSDEVVGGVSSDDARARVLFDQPGIDIAIRFAPNEWRVIATMPKGTSDSNALADDVHRARLESIFGPDCVTQTKWKSIFNIHRRHAQRFSVGRVALAGDAAHLNSPAGGQGMNAGIQDAANLAWKIAYALRGRGDGDALFASYSIERREMVTDTVEAYSDRITRIAIGLTPRVKRTGIRIFSRVVRGRGMQCKLARTLGMLNGRYTTSPIIDAHHPLAGRRIDDLLLEDGERINRTRSGNAALVLVGEAPLGDLSALRVAAAPKRWHVKPPVVLIVRPDGCVASVIQKPTRERIESAWNTAFCGTIELPPTQKL